MAMGRGKCGNLKSVNIHCFELPPQKHFSQYDALDHIYSDDTGANFHDRIDWEVLKHP